MKALIIGFIHDKRISDGQSSLDELEKLCIACNIEVKEKMLYSVREIHPAYYIGSGKAESLRDQDVDVYVFDDELTPLQMKNLEDILEKEVIDRTGVILRIFESRAKTKEAKLQVKMAKMRYLLPRLSEFSVDLIGQQKGSGFRGSGEKQSELTKRQIYRKLVQAQKELMTLKKQRATQRTKRKNQEEKVIALVGYTNSGKSSLLNYFMNRKDKTVLEKDMLFASLETSSRKVNLARNHSCIMSDTVGFISGLPHHLVEAFKSTLEEVKEADLLIHVVDSSNPDYLKHIEVVNKVLEDLEANEIPMIYAYNKVDLDRYAFIEEEKESVFISVKNKINLDALEDKIISMCFKEDVYAYFRIPYDCSEDYLKIHHSSHIIKEEYLDDGIYLEVECSKKLLGQYEKYHLMN